MGVKNVAGLVVRSGVAIPPRRCKSKYDVLKTELKVGDSFVWPKNPVTLYSITKRLGIKVTVRKVDGQNVAWRVA